MISLLSNGGSVRMFKKSPFERLASETKALGMIGFDEAEKSNKKYEGNSKATICRKIRYLKFCAYASAFE
jgi:hypothetical protein